MSPRFASAMTGTPAGMRARSRSRAARAGAAERLEEGEVRLDGRDVREGGLEHERREPFDARHVRREAPRQRAGIGVQTETEARTGLPDAPVEPCQVGGHMRLPARARRSARPSRPGIPSPTGPPTATAWAAARAG